MARTIVHAYVKMIVRSDRFHADPHPRQLHRHVRWSSRPGRLGEVGTVAATTRSALTRLLVAVVSRDSSVLTDAVLSIRRECRPVERAGLGRDLAALLDPIIDGELQDIQARTTPS